MKATRLIVYGLIVAAIIIGGVYFATKSPGVKEEEGGYYIANAQHRRGNAWEALYAKAFTWYCDDHGHKLAFTNAQMTPRLQIEQIRRLVDMGVDGIFLAPVSEKGVNRGIEYAHDHGVPVITAGFFADSKYPILHVSSGNVEMAKIAAEHVVEHLKDKYGEPKGLVLNLRGTTGSTGGDQRSEGFMDVMKNYPEIEVITHDTKFSPTKAKTLMEQIIQTKDVDAIYNANLGISNGSQAGLESLGEDPEDYYIVSIDAGPSVLKDVRKGRVDLCIDQGPRWYGPIATHYLVRYLEEGEEAIPDVGDTITAGDLKLDMGLHYGKNLYEEPTWAPAHIRDLHDLYGTEHHQKFFRIDPLVINENNADDPSIWGNLELPGW